MADKLTDLYAYDDVEANGGTQQAVVPLPFQATDFFELGGAETATFMLDQLHASFSSVIHESVLRAEFADGEVQEWRVREIELSRENDNARIAVVECESILFDLIHNSDMLERIEQNGDVKNHFELYGLSPTQHATKILEAAPSYFALGTVQDITNDTIPIHEELTWIRDRVDMIYHNDSPLSALQELAVVSGLELEIVRNGATDYKVHLYRQRGDGATTVTVTHATDLLGAKRKTLSSDMGTQVYPRGGQEFGNEGSMANHAFLLAEQATVTLDFFEELFSEDDQLNGFYIEDSTGAFIEITDTVAPSRIVCASAPDFTLHSRVRFRRLSGGVYGALTFLPSPAAQATYGKKPALLDRPDIPLIDNIVPNAFMRDDLWTGDIPNSYQLVGSPGVLKNTDQLYTRHGGASWHIVTNGIGTGVESKAFRVIPTENNPFLTIQAQLYVVEGNVRMELIDVTTGDVFPPVGRDAATVATDVWIDSFGVAPGGDPEDNFFTRGTQQVKIRLTQIGDTAAEFYLDSLQLTQTPSFTTVFYGGRASNDLWLLAKEALETLITPSAEYDVEMIDFNRIDDGTYPNPLVVGGDVTMSDAELGISFTTRILSRRRNLLIEGDSKIEVEGKTNDLTRITGATDRRIRAAVGGAQGTLEGQELDPRPPDSTDNLLSSCCSLAEAENCSPDSAGAWENEPACDILLGAGGLSIGNPVAWSATLKTTVTDPDAGVEGEVNAAGTLKKTEHNVLLQDALDTKDNVVDDVGSSSIAGGKLRITGGSRIRFTGFTAAATIVAQIRFGAGLWPWKYGGLLGRLDASGDGYGHRDQSPSEGTHGLLRLDAGVPTMLDTVGVYSVGGGSYPEHYMKVLVADSLQRSHLGGGIGPTWGFNDTDAVHNGQTGTAGFFVESGGQRFVVWDLIVCPSNVVTCSGLPTDYKIEMLGAGQATEVAGTATLDLGSTLMPLATLTVKSDLNAVVATLSPASGIYGGNVFVYDSGGALTGESTFDVETQVQLDFLEADLTPISTAVMPTGSRSAAYERLQGSAIIPALTGIIRVVHRRIGTTAAISCAKEIMVNIGSTPAPWVPCELAEIATPSGGAFADALANRGGELILNYEWGFTSPGYGDYWGSRPSGTGVINAATPVVSQIDFELDPNEWIRLEQVDDADDDVTKDADSTNYRLVPVVAEDFITVVGNLVRDASGMLGGVWTDIEFFDEDKVAIGPALPGNGVAWSTSPNSQGRRIWTFRVGDVYNSSAPEDIRYMRFQLNANASGINADPMVIGFEFFRAWANLPQLHSWVRLELQGDNTVDLIYQSDALVFVAYKAQTTGFPTVADQAPTFDSYFENEYLWNDGTYVGNNSASADTAEDILGGVLAEGDTCYVAYITGDMGANTNRPDRIGEVRYLTLSRAEAAVPVTHEDSGVDGLKLSDTAAVTVIGIKAVSASDGLKLGDTGIAPLYEPPTANLMLDANPDLIPDADTATITSWPNAAADNAFLDVIGTPKVIDGVGARNHRIMRMAAGDHYVRWTADSSHSDACSVYSVAEITGAPGNLTMGVVGLYQSASERNGFFYRHTSTHYQGFWNNETSWLHASTSTPTISDDVLYARGWTVTTAAKTIVDLRYYSEDSGTPVEEVETSQPDNGMEEFNKYTVGRTGSSTSDFEGDIHRVLVYDVVHTPSEAAAIVAGLRLEYGST